MRFVFLIILFSLLASLSLKEIKSSRFTNQLSKERLDELSVLYLPKTDIINSVTFGFNNLLADYFWFKTVNYFGKHYKEDQVYTWLYHMCDLVTNLDPKFYEAYRFSGYILSWEANQPEKAVSLLTRGIMRLPDNWNLLFARAITNLFFLKKEDAAVSDLIKIASHKEKGAHTILAARLASKIKAKQGDANDALDILQIMIANATSENERAALISRRDEIINKRAWTK